jgi:hypothetical protein
VILQNVDAFQTQHDHLGHPSIWTTYAIWKLILRPSPIKINTKPLKFLERIQCDICGPIQPLSELLRYFIVLINTSTRFVTHVSIINI